MTVTSVILVRVLAAVRRRCVYRVRVDVLRRISRGRAGLSLITLTLMAASLISEEGVTLRSFTTAVVDDIK